MIRSGYGLASAFGLALVLALTAPAAAEEPAPPAKEEPAKEAPAPAEPAAAAPAKEEPAKEAPVAAAPAAAAPAEAPKELGACAKSLAPLADSYKKAYDDLQKWIASVDSQTTAADANIKKMQDQIQQNEAAITKAKIDGDDKKAKDLEKQNKTLWSDLNAAKKTQSTTCSGFTKEAEQRVKQYEADIEAKLKAFAAAAK